MKKVFYFLSFLGLLNSYAPVCSGQGDIITYFSGTLSHGSYGMVFDAGGNLYFAGDGIGAFKVTPGGVVTQIVGNSSITAGYTGDGGPATAAQCNGVYDIAIDAAGNLYIPDYWNGAVRKITPAGIITSVVGNGTYAYSGDGGPATAAHLQGANGIAIDAAGNMYISDIVNGVIRKVNTSGIITRIAGTVGTLGFSGDGGPATAATLNKPLGMTVDAAGNLYVADEANNRIRKIDTAGIITTVAGNGTAGETGDGGPAILAEIHDPYYLRTDLLGNIYFSDTDNVIRKLDAFGFISTVAGNGIAGSSGNGGLATLAELNFPTGVAFDALHNLYLADFNNFEIRKVSFAPDIIADSFSVYLNYICSGVGLTTETNTTGALTLKSTFGDCTGETDTLIASGIPGTQYVHVDHAYNTPGTYTIKEVLDKNGSVIDSAHFSYQSLFCNSLALEFYYDANNNCVKDSSEPYIYLPVTVEVDSNGVEVAVISTTSGINYTAYGGPGDVYTFKVIGAPPGLVATCPATGTVYDTLSAGIDNTTKKYIAMQCNTGSGYDMQENVAVISGRHVEIGTILVSNPYCTPENGVVTMNFSPKYIYESAAPTPASVTGNTITWNLSDVTAYASVPVIHFTLTVPGAYLTPGDTVTSGYRVTPIVGDLDTTNNDCIINDTVRGSFDPNEMAVSPGGYILSGTQLQYTIQFENTGNDTAFNISVYDTLSDNVDVNSMRIVAASAAMNTILLKDNGHNVLKFDFPNINLLDSSHHDLCNGMLRFNINTLTGLPIGTTIFNHAGIFFDNNAVVMTDTVEDIIGIYEGIAATPAASTLSIFPNPATTSLTIQSSIQPVTDISIANLLGQEVGSKHIAGGSLQASVDISALPAGVYFVKVNGGAVKKFVKE